MRISKIVFCCWLFVGSAFTPLCQAMPDLPSDVMSIDRDMKALGDLFERLQSLPSNDMDVLHWLDEKAFALPPLFRYELARRFNVAGLRQMALLELARARLGRDIDAAECVRRDRNTPWDFWVTLTNSLETMILNTPRFDKNLWLKSISDALAFEPHRRQTSALWLCGQNNLKDTQAASEGRKAAYEFLRADFEKMTANANGKGR